MVTDEKIGASWYKGKALIFLNFDVPMLAHSYTKHKTY